MSDSRYRPTGDTHAQPSHAYHADVDQGQFSRPTSQKYSVMDTGSNGNSDKLGYYTGWMQS